MHIGAQIQILWRWKCSYTYVMWIGLDCSFQTLWSWTTHLRLTPRPSASDSQPGDLPHPSPWSSFLDPVGKVCLKKVKVAWEFHHRFPFRGSTLTASCWACSKERLFSVQVSSRSATFRRSCIHTRFFGWQSSTLIFISGVRPKTLHSKSAHKSTSLFTLKDPFLIFGACVFVEING